MKQIYIFYFLFLLTTQLSFSQVVNPTNATTTATNITGSLNASYDQTGLISPSTSTITNHRGARTSNSFACACQNPTFDFVLGGTFTVDGIIFWNSGSDDATIFTDDGINSVKFYSSIDGIAFSEIIGAPTYFTENDYLTSLYDEILAQSSTFAGVEATHIRMEVLSNFHNLDFTAFSEIAFASNNVLSTGDLVPLKSIKVYPNPASEFIKLTGLDKSEKYKIYNILGSEISDGNLSNEEKLDVRDFPNGLYFLKFDNGNTLKFLKE